MDMADIRKLVKRGENRIKIVFELRERAFQGKTGIEPIELMFDPVMIVGDFMVEWSEQNDAHVLKAEKGELHTGTWTHQGYPFYSGAIEYVQQVQVEQDFLLDRKCFLELESVHEIVELEVNGKRKGVRLWRPYIFEVTDSLRSGLNDIKLRVWNTLTNLLDLKDYESGITGDVRLIARAVKKIAI
jgi:hypothetical protein